MKIAIILGSVRTGRKSHLVDNYLVRLLQAEEGVSPNLLDLKEYDLPLLSDCWAKQDPPPESLVQFGDALQQADGILLISPEYHGSYIGVLKNALDHYWQEFQHKPMGVVSTSTGKFGGINGSIHMQQLILSLGAFPIPKRWVVPHIQEVFDPTGNLTDPSAQKGAHLFLKEFLWFTKAITQAKQISPTL
ncbi:MAG: NAD(P)H-dependent oxidoreductase [Bacteroidota bacterium]